MTRSVSVEGFQESQIGWDGGIWIEIKRSRALDIKMKLDRTSTSAEINVRWVKSMRFE